MTHSATAPATRKYLQSFWGDKSIRNLGRTGLATSAAGFGCYRVTDQEDAHKEALKKALESGINLIDTSSNYSDGHSEKLIGQVLAEPEFQRENYIVVSKAGYIQGANHTLVEEREQSGKPYGEVVKYAEGLWHCIHPEFLEDQLNLSLERLQLKKIDVFLIHNPEYYFLHLSNTGAMEDIEKAQYTFYDRIRKAFAHLETLVDKGLISHYGVSSNNFVLPTSHTEATSVEIMLNLAEEISRDLHDDPDKHHFSVIQCPLNIFETGAVTEKNNDGISVCDFAAKNNMALLANRPLNAITGKGMIRLAKQQVAENIKSVDEAKVELSDVEDQFNEDFGSYLKELIEKHGTPFKITSHLRRDELDKVSGENWSRFAGTSLIPEVLSVCKSLDNVLGTTKAANDWQLWKSNYFRHLEAFVQAVYFRAIKRENDQVDKIEEQLSLELPGFKKLSSLDQKAIHSLMAFPGLSCVLVGMRQTSYVESVTTMMKNQNFNDMQKVLDVSEKIRTTL